MSNVVSVHLWGDLVGALLWDEKRQIGSFEYDPGFVKKGLDVAPFVMPVSKGRIFSFPENVRSDTFNGLPGLLADSLPDKFGNEILKVWLTNKGISVNNLHPAHRLSYVGTRGMGALEFKPAEHSGVLNKSVNISIEEMSSLCETIILGKKTLDVTLTEKGERADKEAMNDIIRIGSSAGGAKPKAIIAMNQDGHVLSGQVDAPEGYKHYMIKFDIAGNYDRERNNGIPPASGRVEYAYYLMAEAAKIRMSPCRLMEIDGQGHFLTERFDRVGNEKIHIQTLAAIDHLDRDYPHDYSQLMKVIRKLNLGANERDEMYKRMVFNVLTYNHDDHTKNHAFMMNKQGVWSLTPAYDVTYAYDPEGKWTKQHQMSVFGKHIDITQENLISAAEESDIPSRQALTMIDQVKEAIAGWDGYAKEAGLDEKTTSILKSLLQSELPQS